MSAGFPEASFSVLLKFETRNENKSASFRMAFVLSVFALRKPFSSTSDVVKDLSTDYPLLINNCWRYL